MPETITILLPAHNEEFLLEKTVQDLLSTKIMKERGQILIIENGSTDRTPEIAAALNRKFRQVSVLIMKQAGYGQALRQGILSSNAAWTVIFNVDYYDLAFLQEAWRKRKENDIILGSKRHEHAQDLRPRWRRLVTRVFNNILTLCFGYRGTDTHGMKFMRHAVILPLAKRSHDFCWLFDTELMLRAQWEKLRVTELPIRTFEQRQSVSSISGRVILSIREILQIWWIFTRELKPLPVNTFLLASIFFVVTLLWFILHKGS